LRAPHRAGADGRTVQGLLRAFVRPRPVGVPGMSAAFEESHAHASLSGIRHAFFGRRGGVSAGDFASLNVSAKGGDRPDFVAHNRSEACEAAGFAANMLVTVRQVHSAEVLTIGSASQPDEQPEADAMVTRAPGLALGILTADCAPVLLADPAAGVI